ncbi:MAG: hypothetical protein H7332_12450 [Bdellovibrionales bacterium]|nr:hypothetical protein [Ramlibacter sp.]
MNKDVYKELMHTLAALLGLGDQSELIHVTGNLVFKDVALTIFPGENEPALVNVFVDFGTFPRDKAEEIFRRTYPLQGLSAQKLLGSIDIAVKQALVWHSDFYLDRPSSQLHRQPDLRHAIHV